MPALKAWCQDGRNVALVQPPHTPYAPALARSELEARPVAITEGDLLNIPHASLTRRFGQDLPDYLQRMLGERADVRRRHRVPLVYRRRVDFMEGVESVEGLLFPLRRALQEIEGYLRDAIRLFALLREKLERTQLAAPVLAIALAADEFVEPQITQGDFFDDHLRRNDSWSALLDKLRARLMVVQGELQSEMGVVHAIADEIRDYSHWLGRLPVQSRDFR